MKTRYSRTRRPSKRLRAVALIVSLVALLGLVGTGTAAAKGKPILWGAQIGAQLTGEAAPWDPGAITKFSSMVGKPMSLVSFGSPFADCRKKPCTDYGFPTTPMENVRAYGAIPMFSWGSEGSEGSADEPAFRLSKIAAGKYDPYIRQFAEKAREWGHPFFLRFDWEMNGFWFPWGAKANKNKPHDFIAAWRHVHNIFESVGATNATWVWCPNVDFTRKLSPLSGLYPGDKYVDWTCLDGFNWGATKHSIGWQSFKEVFGSTYQRMLQIAHGKPMMIGETAADDRGGSKPKWIEQMLKELPKKFPKVRALVWYNEKDQGMHWPLESSQAATKAFAKGIRQSVYQINRYGQYANVKIAAPTWGLPPTELAPPPLPVE
jgi:hypothetical protein